MDIYINLLTHAPHCAVLPSKHHIINNSIFERSQGPASLHLTRSVLSFDQSI